MAATFDTAVEFMGVKTREGVKEGNAWKMSEAIIFVSRLGRVQIPIEGTPKLPEIGKSGFLSLDVEQGKFNSLRLVWNEKSTWKQVAA